tara:strand:+ start:11914 stop:12204 length:291 start_codon:yes stop_codon:yes gene_type:complete
MSILDNKDVQGFSFSKKAYKGINKPCYDHREYSTTGLLNEMTDTIPNIKSAIRGEGMTGVYANGVIHLYESHNNAFKVKVSERVGKVSLTLVGGDV